MKTAIVIGATGLVGKQLVKQLITDELFSDIKLFTRRPAGFSNQKIEEHIIDFEHLDAVKKEISGDILFSCLGTTLKQAGSKEAQYRIDFTYQYEFAKLANNNGVKQYMLVSSPSANPKSMIFYTRIKGELEEATKKLGFSKISIIQPSVLMGDREVERKGEAIGAKVINVLGRVLPFVEKYRGISGETVAKAMLTISKAEVQDRVKIYKLDELFIDN